MDADEAAYRVRATADGFDVVFGDALVAVACRDRASAEHYASLLNQAYARGHRAGFRAGKGNR